MESKNPINLKELKELRESWYTKQELAVMQNVMNGPERALIGGRQTSLDLNLQSNIAASANQSNEYNLTRVKVSQEEEKNI